MNALEVSKLLGVSEQRARTLARNGDIQASMEAGRWSYDTDSVLSYFSNKEPCIDHPIETPNANQSACGPVLSFFSGAMGLDLGLEQAGLKTSLVCEIDKAARKTIAANRPHLAMLDDINRYTSDDILEMAGNPDEVFAMVGGPPCQAFSSAGKRRGLEDERGSLLDVFIDRVLDIRPKYAVIENVRGLLSAPLRHVPHKQRSLPDYEFTSDQVRGTLLLQVVNRLRESGYGVSFNLYNSANFGTPQKRERVIIICCRNGTIAPYLKPTHDEHGRYALPKWKTFRDAVSSLDNVEHEHLDFPEKRLVFYRQLTEGQNWRNLPEEVQKAAMGKSYYSGGGKTGFLRRLSWDMPSPTLVTHPAMPATDLCHPSSDRPLSVQEYANLQDFPSEWAFQGSLTDRYKQIGNAVPVKLGYAVGNTLLDIESGQQRRALNGFPYSRYKNTDHVSWEADVLKRLSEFSQDDQLCMNLIYH